MNLSCSPLSGQVLAAAERWYVRLLAADCSADERSAWQAWHDADPAHAAAYARVARVSGRMAEFHRHARYGDAALEIGRRAARRGERRRAVRRGLLLAAAACVAAFATGIAWQRWDPAMPQQHYATGTGERRTLALEDGSELLLDSDSEVTVRYSRRQRLLVLERGQAQFSVAHAPQRPFLVRAGSGIVRAVGTRFQVRRLADSVQVALLEGVVTVSEPVAGEAPRQATLAAGEGLRFGAGAPWTRHRVDLEAAQGWPQGELIFRERPLAELVEEVNRHNTVKLRIGDASLNGLRFSGVVYAGDPVFLLKALERVWSVRAEPTPDGEIVLRAQQ